MFRRWISTASFKSLGLQFYAGDFFPLKQIFLAMHFRDLLTKNFHGKFFARTIKDLTVVSVIFIHDGT